MHMEIYTSYIPYTTVCYCVWCACIRNIYTYMRLTPATAHVPYACTVHMYSMCSGLVGIQHSNNTNNFEDEKCHRLSTTTKLHLFHKMSYKLCTNERNWSGFHLLRPRIEVLFFSVNTFSRIKFYLMVTSLLVACRRWQSQMRLQVIGRRQGCFS